MPPVYSGAAKLSDREIELLTRLIDIHDLKLGILLCRGVKFYMYFLLRRIRTNGNYFHRHDAVHEPRNASLAASVLIMECCTAEIRKGHRARNDIRIDSIDLYTGKSNIGNRIPGKINTEYEACHGFALAPRA